MDPEQNADSPEAYRRILERNPTDERAANNLLVLLMAAERVAEARELCRKFHAAGGVSAGAAINAVYFFTCVINDEDGIKIASMMIARARRCYPRQASVWCSSYWLSGQEQDYHSAMSHAAKAAALDPQATFQCLRINTPLTA